MTKINPIISVKINKLKPVMTPIKHGVVGSALALAVLTPSMSSCCVDKSSGCNEYLCETSLPEAKPGEITKGFVTDRNIKEIEQITGLNEIEYKTATKLLRKFENNLSESVNGNKQYLLGTKYKAPSLFNDEQFSLIFGNVSSTKSAEYKYNKKQKEFSMKFYVPFILHEYNQYVKIIREKNGDFTCIGNSVEYDGYLIKYDEHSVIRNYTKDGKIKTGSSYIPNTISEKEDKY